MSHAGSRRVSIRSMFDVFGLDEERKAESVPRLLVDEWMSSSDLEILGTLHGFLDNGANLRRVEPSLSYDEFFEFSFRYFERCIKENVQTSLFVESRYGASHAVVCWCSSFDHSNLDINPYAKRIKKWIEKMYALGDPEICLAIETGILEHLFEKLEYRTFFSDWNADPHLAGAFRRSLEWEP